MRACLLVAFVLLFTGEAAESAPAPVRRPGSSCEVIFDARTTRRATVAERYLRSDQFADELLAFDGVRKQLAHLKSHDERRAWLQKRMTVTADRERLRVRLDGPMPILRVLADALTRDRGREGYALREECHARLGAVVRLRAQGVGTESEYFEAYQQVLRCELLVDPLEVLQAPRYLDPVR